MPVILLKSGGDGMGWRWNNVLLVGYLCCRRYVFDSPKKSAKKSVVGISHKSMGRRVVVNKKYCHKPAHVH